MSRRGFAFHSAFFIVHSAFLISCKATSPKTEIIKADPALAGWNDRCTRFLAEVVDRFGAVDYPAARRKLDVLQSLIRETGPVRRLACWSDRTALLINAYNLLVIEAICVGGNIESPREMPGLFNRRRWRILDQELTLDQLRDQYLRPIGDPRIHAALCYGALGSPPLAAEAYRGETLSAQLDKQCRRWLQSPTAVSPLGDLLLVSALFQWFEPDFQADPYGSTVGFLRRYAEPGSQVARMLGEKTPPGIEYLDFNWAINAAESATSQ